MDVSSYKEALRRSLESIVFDVMAGKAFSFEKLYYPLIVEDGELAFLSYAEQVSYAEMLRSIGMEDKGFVDVNEAVINPLQVDANIDATAHVQVSEDFDRSTQELYDRVLAAGEKESNLYQNVSLNSSDYRVTLSENADPILLEETEKKDIFSGLAEAFHEDNYRDGAGGLGIPKWNGEMSGQSEESGHSDIEATNEPENGSKKLNDIRFLFPEEERRNRNSLLVSGKRVVAIANAGHGKTTLLRRIALHYCMASSDYARSKEIEKIYGLTGDFVPLLLRLRQLRGKITSFNAMLEMSLADYVENPAEWLEEYLCSFTSEQNPILLIDGLDELTASQRAAFLNELRVFLNKYPTANIILTSRLAGLLEGGVVPALRDMRFVARTILPLTDEDAAEYSTRWIEETQEDVQQKQILKRRLESVLTQPRYHFLKEFMRTPLELLVVLRQLSGGTLSLNRSQLFRDVLFGLFTGHEKYDRKSSVYKDSMSILGLIAYRMQKNNSLYISLHELQESLADFNRLSYYSDIIKEGTLEEIESFLDDMASNVGIVERLYQNDEVNYTFPIRSYQEYLAAYACCNLIVEQEHMKPMPYEILYPYISKDEWMNLINFALADMQDSNPDDYSKLMENIFEAETNLHRLSMVIEADLKVDFSQAMLLCKKWFFGEILEDDRKDLLLAWNGTGAGSSYNYALNRLYSRAEGNAYLEAYALSDLLSQLEYDDLSLQSLVESLIFSPEKKDISLGAMTVIDSVKLYFSELVEGYRKKMEEELSLPDDYLERIGENAILHEDVFSVRVLTDLRIAQKGNIELIHKLLDKKRRDIVIAEILKNEDLAKRLLEGDGMTAENRDYTWLLFLFVTLGSFPFEKDRGVCELPEVLKECFDMMFAKASKVSGMDQAALAVCSWYLGFGRGKYLDVWAKNMGRISQDKLYKDPTISMYSLRERMHASLVEAELADAADSDGSGPDDEVWSFGVTESAGGSFDTPMSSAPKTAADSSENESSGDKNILLEDSNILSSWL